MSTDCLKDSRMFLSGLHIDFLGAFAKLRKAIISFEMSVHRQGTIRLPLDGLSRNLILSIFRKSAEKIQGSLKSHRNNGYCT
jgi:hypothetical protein